VLKRLTAVRTRHVPACHEGLQIGRRRSDQLTKRWLAERYDNSCIFGELPVYTARPTDRVKRERCLIPRKDDGDEENSEKKANVRLPGTVEKIIPAVGDHMPEKAEIKIEGADDLYREVRIENKMIDAGGNTVKLKKGAEVDVTIEADKKDTSPKE
jgi:hypothetical protein